MKLIIYAIVFYIFYMLIKKALFPAETRRRPTDGGGASGAEHGGGGGGGRGGFSTAEETVQDPVCKAFILKASALSHTDGRGTHYFCGDECLGRYKDEG